MQSIHNALTVLAVGVGVKDPTLMMPAVGVGVKVPALMMPAVGVGANHTIIGEAEVHIPSFHMDSLFPIRTDT
ncbi:Lysosomal cystine transporter [Penicillium cf. griseofulvum]|nr:Lysosomal cystine transporter [Penicillium cf. griseofulvum]